MPICENHPEYLGGKPDNDCPKCTKHFYQEDATDIKPNIKKRDPYKRRERHKKDWLNLSEEE